MIEWLENGVATLARYQILSQQDQKPTSLEGAPLFVDAPMAISISGTILPCLNKGVKID